MAGALRDWPISEEIQTAWVAREHNKSLAPTPFLALETPHVIVEMLTDDIIEDVIDNLMALGVFESVFAQFETEARDTDIVGT